MKELSEISLETTINENYQTLIDIIDSTFNDDRKNSLITLYSDYEQRIKESPASGKMNFHLAVPGGYLQHILNVIDNSMKVTKLYKEIGGHIDFTKEELIFSAMHHDLGKLGTLDDPYYITQTSEWHIEHKLEMFKHNDDRQYMNVSDMSLFILQSYKIAITQKEFLGIILADGLYGGDKTKQYLINYSGPFPMRSNLPYILHWADHMSAQSEKDIIQKDIF